MNIGELTNKGIELSVYGTPIQNKDWNWELRGNLAWNKNTVKKLADGLDVLSHQTFDGGAASLESHVVESILSETKVKASDVDEVIVGNVLMAGQFQGVARQISVNAGIPYEVPAYGINLI
jgi:hypothetical protein